MDEVNVWISRSLKLGFGGGVLCLVLTTVFISVRLKIARHQVPDPQAILMLGGEKQRDIQAAQLAQHESEMTAWISTQRSPDIIYQRFADAGVPRDRVIIDDRATDTLMNFTTTVAALRAHNIRHVYLVTADYHMPRAEVIAFWIFGSRGIVCTPVNVQVTEKNMIESGEHAWKIPRDIVRSWVWLATGWPDSTSTTKNNG